MYRATCGPATALTAASTDANPRCSAYCYATDCLRCSTNVESKLSVEQRLRDATAQIKIAQRNALLAKLKAVRKTHATAHIATTSLAHEQLTAYAPPPPPPAPLTCAPVLYVCERANANAQAQKESADLTARVLTKRETVKSVAAAIKVQTEHVSRAMEECNGWKPPAAGQ